MVSHLPSGPGFFNNKSKPAKRRATAAAASAPKARQSKLAKEHNITAAEENEIKEAFELFSIEKKGEKEGVIPTEDVRRAMMYFLFLSKHNPVTPPPPRIYPIL
jgi:hypothetical protein